MRALLILAILIGLSAAAPAQTRLPRTSPTEQQIQDINRSLDRQQRSLTEQQQSQFEVNQLRQSLGRVQTSPLNAGPAGATVCDLRRIGC